MDLGLICWLSQSAEEWQITWRQTACTVDYIIIKCIQLWWASGEWQHGSCFENLENGQEVEMFFCIASSWKSSKRVLLARLEDFWQSLQSLRGGSQHIVYRSHKAQNRAAVCTTINNNTLSKLNNNHKTTITSIAKRPGDTVQFKVKLSRDGHPQASTDDA